MARFVGWLRGYCQQFDLVVYVCKEPVVALRFVNARFCFAIGFSWGGPHDLIGQR